MTVELLYQASGATAGAVLGAVEIIDERLVTVAGTVIRAGQCVPLDLPAGRYLAQGWLPSGDRIWTTFDVTMAGRRSVVVLDPPTAAVQQARRPGGWLRSWTYSGRSWSVGPAPGTPQSESGVLDVTLSSPPGSRRLALQVGGPALAPRITMAPAGCSLRVSHGESGWRVDLHDDIGATLLGYLHRSDLPSAHIVARQVLTESSGPNGSDSALLDTIMGYYLLSTGHELAEHWIPDLAWAQPDSVDATVLRACLMRRDRRTPVAAIRGEFLRAAVDGLPVLATGLRLLMAGLAAVGDDAETRSALDRLRPYAAALIDCPLMTFPANDPGRQTGLHAVSDVAPAGAVTFAPYDPPQSPPIPIADEVAPAGIVDRRHLREALRLLQAGGIGTGPKSDRVTAGDLVVVVTVSPNEDSTGLDVDLAIRIPDTRRVSFSGLIVDIQVDLRLHCVSTIDDAGRCSFVDVPVGTWELVVRERGRGRHADVLVPLPPPVETAMLATSADGMTEIMRTRLPAGQGLLVLRRTRHDRYWLELLAPASAAPTAMGVAYETVNEPVFRLVPVSAGAWGRSSSTLRLDGIDIRRPWHVVPAIDSVEISQQLAADVAESVRAAGSQATRDAWRAFAWELTPDVALVIRTELDHVERTIWGTPPAPESEADDAGSDPNQRH